MFLIEGFTARDSLSLQYDRRPPQHLIEAAERIDRTRRLARPEYFRLRAGRVRLRRTVAIDLMALQIVKAYQARGEVNRRDLVGFSQADILDLGDEAIARACAREPALRDARAAA